MAEPSSNYFGWAIAFRSPSDIWEHHTSYLMAEILYYVMAILTFSHSLKQGGRYVYLWLTILLHGAIIECLSYFVPSIDSFWHAQAMIMLLGKRLPLYMAFLYPVFIYTSAIAVAHLRLTRVASAFATGLGVVLLDVPFDILGVKSLWWTFHDTDPNLYDRFYWVPWNTLFFLCASSASLHYLFFGTRRLFCKTADFNKSDSFFKEIICSLISAMGSMPLATIQLAVIYHPLHDLLGIHTKIGVLILLSTYGLIVLTSGFESKPVQKRMASTEIVLVVLIHYFLYFFLSIFGVPENNQSIGIHQEVGNCNDITNLYTPIGLVLEKKTYLCVEDYDEGYFDFHCLKEKYIPMEGNWYSICGTPFSNQAEYIVVVTYFCLLGLYVYLRCLVFNGAFKQDVKYVENKKYK